MKKLTSKSNNCDSPETKRHDFVIKFRWWTAWFDKTSSFVQIQPNFLSVYLQPYRIHWTHHYSRLSNSPFSPQLIDYSLEKCDIHFVATQVDPYGPLQLGRLVSVFFVFLNRFTRNICLTELSKACQPIIRLELFLSDTKQAWCTVVWKSIFAVYWQPSHTYAIWSTDKKEW